MEEETQEVPADPKLRIVERPVEEEPQEEENSDRGDTMEEDSDDSTEPLDENGDPCLPYFVSWDSPVKVCTAGASYTIEEAEKIVESVYQKNLELYIEWCEMANNNRTPLPLVPLDVLPKITTTCVYGYKCYHRQYWTEITCETAPTHPYFRPCVMMQMFSLRLSSPLAHPVNIYGTFSVRDCWEPLRNYVFKHSRDDPAMIPQGCSFLPLRSPCRGIYLVQYIFFDVDLWIKEEGDGSADKPLFCGYVEWNTSRSPFDSKLDGRLQGDYHGLDIHFTVLVDSIETVIGACMLTEYIRHIWG